MPAHRVLKILEIRRNTTNKRTINTALRNKGFFLFDREKASKINESENHVNNSENQNWVNSSIRSETDIGNKQS